MRIRKPRPASPDEVRISRRGEEAIISFADPTISTTHLRIGPQIHQMSDQAVVFPDILDGHLSNLEPRPIASGQRLTAEGVGTTTLPKG